ncbi:uncharacterized protein LOC110709118 [Chenopodium quinoa]|uniref:Uncharacterized protein n=1 Tax=Chenopodium quinoa TaxID=63459 RepID=A0A803N7I9_CHEQI|nr:uncharacterized protein LOC110709118 [Chenopodium quinoa]XP_021743025.1 uncharacterized protein LOC110709118 [Chenopodium quinoa]XP_021743026.1 uncharacterized protein LOC110709118 [Chenopodium quinoa]
MKLKNMEQKLLNFNQPILSVRRGSSLTAPPENKRKDLVSHSSLPPLPYYKSELKSGPVRNPGVVPFKWEQMPGRPKDENKSRKVTLKWLPPTPKLPPGRIATHMQKETDKIQKDSPTSVSRYQAQISIPQSIETSSPNKDHLDVKGSEKEEEKYNSSSEDEDVTYVDARDTLSRTESFYNCSVSGVSGLDGPESSGAFSDPQTQEFMMGRFLPAAKAVASEEPPFASRKHNVAREQEKPITKVVTLKKQFPEYYSTPDTLLQRINGEEIGEEADEEDESDVPEDLSVKLCGLLPRFCMLNPIPGMRDHVEVISSVRSVRTRSTYAGAFRDDENKVGTKNERGGMKRTSHQHAPVPTNESLMNVHLVRKGMLREKIASPQRFLDKEKQFLGLPGEPRDLSGYRVNSPKNDCTELEFAAPPKTDRISCLVNPAEEKTLYVDYERMVESRHSNSSSSESRGRNPSVDYSLQDICADEKAMTHSKSSDTTYCSAVSTSEKSFQEIGEDMKCLEKVEQNVNLIIVKQPSKQDAKSTKHSKNCSSPLALTPLLPKSPSESWLSRTLPSMSSRNPSSKSYLANHAFRASPVDPKRERLLKAANLHDMLFQSAGELAPILEN